MPDALVIAAPTHDEPAAIMTPAKPTVAIYAWEHSPPKKHACAIVIKPKIT